MVGQRQQDGGGQVVVAAEDQDGAASRQLGQGPVGVGAGGMVHDHDADILARDAGDGLTAAAQQQLLQPHGEVRRLAGNLNGAFDHGPTACPNGSLGGPSVGAESASGRMAIV